MSATRWLLAFVLVALAAPAPARAVDIQPLPFTKALRALGLPTIPASWSGIWSRADTTRDCATHAIKSVSAGMDTLCAGGAFGPDTTTYSCTGSFTDTDFDLTCTYTEPIITGCSAQITDHAHGTRNGNVVTMTTTLTIAFSPTDCAGIPDSCTETTGVDTYVAAEPANCLTTEVRGKSWGQLKMLYR